MGSPSKRKYWLKWTAACGIGEFLGIAVAAGIWLLHSAVFGEPQNIAQQILLVIIMIIAGIIEGLVTGSFQWSVLKLRFTNIRVKNWLFYTALGAAIAWLLGMVPSTLLSAGGPGGFDPSVLTMVLMAASMGLVLGALFGLFQWIELKKHAAAAGRWILANALGWLVGMVFIFLGASMPGAATDMAVIILIGAISGLLGGLMVGAVTGLFLINMDSKVVA